MVNFDTKVIFEEGLHARPASELVKACQAAESDIQIFKGDLAVNPKSILGILTLGASHGDELRIEVNGSDEAEVAARLKEFFANTNIK